MQDLLDKLNGVRGVGGSLVLSADGLAMASALRQGLDETTLAAQFANVIDENARLANQLGLGTLRLAQSISGQGGVLLLAAGPGYLAILMDPAANLALLQIEARPFAERIAQRITL